MKLNCFVVFVSTPLVSEIVQKTAFKRGYQWCFGSIETKYTDSKYLHFYDDYTVRRSDDSIDTVGNVIVKINATEHWEKFLDYLDKFPEQAKYSFNGMETEIHRGLVVLDGENYELKELEALKSISEFSEETGYEVIVNGKNIVVGCKNFTQESLIELIQKIKDFGAIG